MRALLAVVLSGCVSWKVSEIVTEREPLYRYRLALRDDLVSGRASVAADGTIEFAIALDHACELIPQMARRTYVTYESHPTTLAIVMMTVGGLAFLPIAELPNPAAIAADVSGGLLLLGGPVVAQLRAKSYVTRSSLDPKPVDGDDERAPAPCRGIDPIAELGGLELITPWGLRATSPIDRSGLARFTIDWAIAPENDFRLAAPWTVMAAKRPVSGSWRFGDGDVARMRALIAQRTQ